MFRSVVSLARCHGCNDKSYNKYDSFHDSTVLKIKTKTQADKITSSIPNILEYICFVTS